MNWYIEVLKKYAIFEGRARRKEYWMFILFNFFIAVAIGAVESILGISQFLSGLYALIILIPSLAVGVRRLHDTGRSGLWMLMIFVPVIGFFVLLFFFIQDSEPGANQYGANVKY
ncbi:MAG: DUF805 domain-containing protein [Balneolia bacterium]|nr:DUF805 domain-containing protein [Balneolia bacterium]